MPSAPPMTKATMPLPRLDHRSTRFAKPVLVSASPRVPMPRARLLGDGGAQVRRVLHFLHVALHVSPNAHPVLAVTERASGA
jgi:hypothetical protein